MGRNISTKQYVYNQVAQDIITGIYSSDAIITESMLLKKYDVSRVSVREALIELCKDNYLRSIPRTGYMLVTYSLEDVINILDFRCDLEVCNLKRAFQKLTEEKLRALGDDFLNGCFHQIGQGSMIEHWNANMEFHLKLCSLSGNKYVYDVLEKLLRNSSYYQQFYRIAWNGPYSFDRKHSRIVSALLDRDLNLACEILGSNINEVKMSLIDRLK